MLDADIVAVSPATVWRVLSRAGLLQRWNGKPSKKGTGFEHAYTRCGVLLGMRTPRRVILPIIGLAFFSIQSLGSPPKRMKCTVQEEEKEIYVAYLHATDSPGSIRLLVTETDRRLFGSGLDWDSINLRLAANGRGIPPDVRHDFEEKNKASCAIEPIVGIERLRLISKSDEDKIFKTGWDEFHKKYGKDAECVSLSRVGFNAGRSLALLHVSGGIGPMAAGGMLYVFERKDGQWTIKTQVATWTT